MIPALVVAGKNTKNAMAAEDSSAFGVISSELKFFLGAHNSELFLSFTPNSALITPNS